MASLRCLHLTATLAALTAAGPVFALQALDDLILSDVTGQAQGLKITQEQEVVIDSLTYYDDDGLGAPGSSAGTITLSNVRRFTPKGVPTIQDIEVRDTAKGRALVITNHQLEVNQEIGDVAINGKSLGSQGQNNYRFGAGDTLVTSIRAGGYLGTNGMSIDVEVPSSLSYDQWKEMDGVRSYVTVNYDDPYNKGQGGIKFENITIDITDDGLRIGLPTTTRGFINQYNNCVGTFKDCRDPEQAKHNVTSSNAFRNVNFMPGGYVLVKNAKGASEYGLELDARVKAGTNLDYIDIFGEVGDSYPNANVFEMSAHLHLNTDLIIEGMRMNVDGERGLVFDFDNTTPHQVASANLVVSDVTLMRSDRVKTTPNPVSIGTLDLQLNLGSRTYIQMEGH